MKKGYKYLLLAAGFTTLGYCIAAKEEQANLIPMRKSHGDDLQHAKLTHYFAKNNSPKPGLMADAVMATKKENRRLIAAMAVKESNGTPSLKNTGYKKRHSGSFQVSSRHWGAVPDNVVQQALQCEKILEELIQQKKGLIPALNYYGGDKTKKIYAKNILAEYENVP